MKTEVTLYHIDGKINLADLLTKQHELSTQAVTLNSEWQTGLPWMRLDTESMLLLAYNQFRVEKTIEDEVKVECYDDAMTGEFSQFEENKVLLVHDKLKVDKPTQEQVRIDFTKTLIENTREEVEKNSTFLAFVRPEI